MFLLFFVLSGQCDVRLMKPLALKRGLQKTSLQSYRKAGIRRLLLLRTVSLVSSSGFV